MNSKAEIPPGYEADGVRELTSVEAFRLALSANEPIVITDTARPAKAVLHPNASECPGIQERYFVQKVIQGRRANGGYYVASERAARTHWPQLAMCTRCSGAD